MNSKSFFPRESCVSLVGFALPLLLSTHLASAQIPEPSPIEAPSEQMARLTVREKHDQPIRVLIDGVDRGAAPLTIDLPVDSYEVSGLASTFVAAAQRITLHATTPTEVVLEASSTTARIEVRTNDGQGTILIDGQSVGQGRFDGDLSIGEHLLTVEREGFEPFSKTLKLTQGQVLVESITLERQAESDVQKDDRKQRVRDGFYGGIQAGLAFMPGGSDHTLATACPTTGASSCDSSKPWGLLAQGYVGYALEPLGFELMLGLLGDKATPNASFDGVHGSSINPLVAQPPREEEFKIYRGGFVGALRVRGSYDLSAVRLYGAMGVGLAWKVMGLLRTVTTTDGTNASNRFAPDMVRYVSPGVSLDVGAFVPIGETTGLTVGAWLWAETAKDHARTQDEPNRVIVSESGRRPLATPQYDLANGGQVYIGPYIGMQFGP